MPFGVIRGVDIYPSRAGSLIDNDKTVIVYDIDRRLVIYTLEDASYKP